MRARWMAVLAAMLESGCMAVKPGASAGSPGACMTENARFLDAWSCVRARLVTRRQEGTAPSRDGLIDEGDILADQVRAGAVSEAEARKRLDVGLAHHAS